MILDPMVSVCEIGDYLIKTCAIIVLFIGTLAYLATRNLVTYLSKTVGDNSTVGNLTFN